MLLCCKCYKKDCRCEKPRFENIDDNIIDDIIILNKKGYKTVACCEGHKKRPVFDFYIMFMNTLDVDTPKSFKISKNKKIIRYTKDSKKVADGQVTELRKIFHEWVQNLPNLAV